MTVSASSSASDTRFFDCLVGYFFISGFHQLHPALAKTEKIYILIGIKTDRPTFELLQTAKAQQEFALESHAYVRQQLPAEILSEFERSGDSSDIEDGVRTFAAWIQSSKLEVRAYPSGAGSRQALHHDVPGGRPRPGPRHHRFQQLHRGGPGGQSGIQRRAEESLRLRIRPRRSSTSFGTSPWT
ncbi:MAG: hypothetical protein M0C28_24720 [Candidatus Moduliflexus flocculans]|nr:hypothetical protein [Candidatus Moduliflexus flocculans]